MRPDEVSQEDSYRPGENRVLHPGAQRIETVISSTTTRYVLGSHGEHNGSAYCKRVRLAAPN